MQKRIFSSPLWRRSLHTDISKYDVSIIGGGIVGLATALEWKKQQPDCSLAVFEKEPRVALHQSSHNSGVIHAGIYYQPGSDRARLCVPGLQKMYSFLEEHSLPFKKCGKLIVAVDKSEVPELENLYQRGKQNQCPNIRMISKDEMNHIEPYCEGIAAIHSPETGITDFAAVCEKIQELLEAQGVDFYFNYKAGKFDVDSQTGHTRFLDSTGHREVTTSYLVSCAGSESDRIAGECGLSHFPKIIPIRGKWSVIKPEFGYLVKGNIYPVPNPKLPFLGVHFSKKVHSDAIWSGPNSVIALSREGYKTFDTNINDVLDIVNHRGFYRLLQSNWKSGLLEMYHEMVFTAKLEKMKRYIPELTPDHFENHYESGVRAMGVTPQGNLVNDFCFTTHPLRRQLHVRSAPSPAATSCFAIAEEIYLRSQQ